MPGFPGPAGQGWPQLLELGLAFVLSAMVGLEREIRQKNAGLRTHTLVGVAAALIMLISKHGFMDVLSDGTVRIDPSRVAAQVVSGIGFIGGGVIFMRRDVVRGLTTAASIWFVAAVGMACGAGMAILAAATTALYFVVTLGFPLLERRLAGSHHEVADLRICYLDKQNPLRAILARCARLRFDVNHMRLDHDAHAGDGPNPSPAQGTTTLRMEVTGKRPVQQLIAGLSGIDGVQEVGTVDPDEGED